MYNLANVFHDYNLAILINVYNRVKPQPVVCYRIQELCVLKLKFHRNDTDTDTDFWDAPIV